MAEGKIKQHDFEYPSYSVHVCKNCGLTEEIIGGGFIKSWNKDNPKKVYDNRLYSLKELMKIQECGFNLEHLKTEQ